MKSIFISYSSKDKEFVIKLANLLKNLGVKVWIDKGEIKLGDSLLSKISGGIYDSDYLGTILSPNSVNSNWVKTELEIAMNQEINQGKTKVLPLIIKDCDIPKYLLHKKYGDLRNPEDTIEVLNELLELLEPEKNKEEKINKKEYLINAPVSNKISIEKLKEIISYANNPLNGMGLNSKNSSDFGLIWKENYSQYNFQKFKELFQYANNPLNGMGLTTRNSIEWALKALKD